jgi:hypothetical protein
MLVLLSLSFFASSAWRTAPTSDKVTSSLSLSLSPGRSYFVCTADGGLPCAARQGTFCRTRMEELGSLSCLKTAFSSEGLQTNHGTCERVSSPARSVLRAANDRLLLILSLLHGRLTGRSLSLSRSLARPCQEQLASSGCSQRDAHGRRCCYRTYHVSSSSTTTEALRKRERETMRAAAASWFVWLLPNSARGGEGEL